METPSPNDTAPARKAIAHVSLSARAGRALWPLIAAAATSYLLYRASPMLLLTVGAAAFGWLLWGIAHRVLTDTGPQWLPKAVAGGVWLLYAMQLVYGWREEMGYWATVWQVFGWTLFTTLFWAVVLICVVNLLVKAMNR